MAGVDPSVIPFPLTETFHSVQRKALAKLRQNEELTDFTIYSNEKSFPCHRVILASCSPVLKAMMSSGMTEASNQEAKLDNIPPDVVKLLIDYMYIGETEVPNELLVFTAKACDYLELLELRDRCLKKAVDVLKPNNIISWHKLAMGLNVEHLQRKCFDIIYSSLDEVAKHSEFLELNDTEISSYMKAAEETDIDCDDLLEASMIWVNYKPSQRLQNFANVLKNIQLKKCSVECLETQIKIHQALLQSCPVVQGILNDIVIEILKVGGRKKKGPEQGLLIVGGVYNNGEPNVLCWELEPHLMEFSKLCKIPVSGVYYSVCKIPGGFVATGGNESKVCTAYMLSSHSWIKLEKIPEVRQEHGSTFFHGKIFMFGGFISGKWSRSVASLPLEGGRWSKEPELHVAVRAPEVTSVDSDEGSSMYLMDVYGDNQLLQWEVGTKRWKKRTAMPGESCYGARMIEVNGERLTRYFFV